MKTANRQLIDRLAAGLRAAATELEQLQVSLALGKAEAASLFENTKKNLRPIVSSLRIALRGAPNNIFNNKFSARQNKTFMILNFLRAFRRLEFSLLYSPLATLVIRRILSEFGKLRLMINILRLKLETRQLHLKQKMHRQGAKLAQRLQKLNDRLYRTEVQVKDKYQHFREEMGEAYTHFKDAFNMN